MMQFRDRGIRRPFGLSGLRLSMLVILLLTACRSTKVSPPEVIPELALLPAPRAVVLSDPAGMESREVGESVIDEPVAFLNQVQHTETGLEVGPLLEIIRGPLQGVGRISGSAALACLFELLERIPITEQARLVGNRFAATHLKLDIDADDRPEDVFLTIVFPLEENFARDRVNRLSGETERMIYARGELIRTVSSRRITEITRDDDLVESSSRTWLNEGTLADPLQGKLLEESRTTEAWFRDWRAADLDPRLPVLAKIRVNHVTGEAKREVFGLYPGPIEVIDGQFVTVIHYAADGRLTHSDVFENGTTEEEFSRPLLARLTEPLAGRPRFRNEVIDPAELESDLDRGHHLALVRRDLLRGTSNRELRDLTRGGRVLREWRTAELPGAGLVERVRRYQYSDEFHAGQIPIKCETAVDDSVVSTVTTESYDPITRRLTGIEEDHTGKKLTQVWDARWEAPIESRSRDRVTTVSYDRWGDSFEAETVDRVGSEPLASAIGEWGANGWSIERKVWHRPGIVLRTESEERNAHGDLINMASGGLTTQFTYGHTGTEIGRSVFAHGPGGEVSLLVRFEDDYHWLEGARSARVETFLDGMPHDRFAIQSDAEGRLVVDQLKNLPGLGLRTVRQYEGASERLLNAVTFQNGQARHTYTPGPAIKSGEDSYQLEVKVTPHWGLVRHEVHLLNSSRQGPLHCRIENGDHLVARERFPGSALARKLECRDELHLPSELSVMIPGGENVAGIPFDLIERYKIENDGAQTLLEKRAVVRGTDIPLHVDREGRRLHYDHREIGDLPLLETDLEGEEGIAVVQSGMRRHNVTRLLRTRPERRGSEPVRIVESIELNGFFSLPFNRSVYDRAGNQLEEVQGRIPSPGESELTAELLFRALETTPPEQRTRFHFGLASTASERREVTRIDVFRRGGAIAEHEQVLSLARRLTARVEFARNSFLPDDEDGWVRWKVEHISAKGTPEYQSDVVFDRHDHPRVSIEYKENAKGEPAQRIAYELSVPPDGAWQTHALATEETAIELPVPGEGDWSAAHFAAISVRGHDGQGSLRLEFRDSNGREVNVSNAGGDLAFWSPGVDQIQWLPNLESARAAASVRTDDRDSLIVSVPELAASGLATDSIESVRLLVSSLTDGALEYSPVRRMVAANDLPPLDSPARSTPGTIPHSNGLLTSFASVEQEDAYWSADLHFKGDTVAKVRPRHEDASYPVILVQDPSGGVTRPLYALVAESGEFLEFYRQVAKADSRLYTIARGFRPARMESFRGKVIEDEASPGGIAFGEDYRIEVPVSRTSHTHNRIASSVFKLGADRLGDLLRPGVVQSDNHNAARALHRADIQAAIIDKLPTFAGTLLPHRRVPWENAAGGSQTRIGEFEVPFGMEWAFTGEEGQKAATPLWPTAPDTDVEDYVDTQEEGRLIQLAVAVGETDRAAAILDFYWDQSRGGTHPLHASYDRTTGASLTHEPHLKRASEASRTSPAQLAIAEAALVFAGETGDPRAWTLGLNLLEMLCDKYRSWYRRGSPRGISTEPFQRRHQRLGLVLWPKPATYPVETNARALLVLSRACQMASAFSGDHSSVRSRLEKLRDEQRSWLVQFVAPQVVANGIVPDSLFEIQDLQSETSALGVSRWTSARAWLAFLEVNLLMGIEQTDSHRWLENLARVHGVEVKGRWGIDWSIALTRHDAISPELTAYFFKVADVLDHAEARSFARNELVALGAPEGRAIPVVLTESSPARRLATGQNRSVYPLAEKTGWPRGWTPYLHLLENGSLELAHLSGRSGRLEARPPVSNRDFLAFRWGVLGFYSSLLLVAAGWWICRGMRRRNRESRGSGSVLSDALMAAGEQRWAGRVVGMRTPSDSPNSRFADGPIEANFVTQVRAIYKLVLDWRRRENGWEDDDPALTEGEDDPWINGADEFAAMVALYLRFVIKAGQKDGFRHADDLVDPEDSNHLWARLVCYFSEHFEVLRQKYLSYLDADDEISKAERGREFAELLRGIGFRERREGFNGRELFSYPSNFSAFDLLIIQKEGVTLSEVLEAAEERLGIPREHFLQFITNYKEFKHHENPYPLHPYNLEAAKLLPHFVLMALLGIIWYNHDTGGLPVIPFLGETIRDLVSLRSLYWAIPLGFGGALELMARSRARRFRESEDDHEVIADRDPTLYRYAGALLRGAALLALGLEIFAMPAPSFAGFLLLKGVVGSLILLESAAMLAPLLVGILSRGLQERSLQTDRARPLARFLNQLNIPVTRPGSIIWESFRYHYQSSARTGTASSLARSVVSYFAFAAAFLLVGGYIFKAVLGAWFADTYQMGSDWRLVVGAIVFFNTMYLLRFGLFVLVASVAAAVRTWPLKVSSGLIASFIALGMFADLGFRSAIATRPEFVWALVLACICFIIADRWLLMLPRMVLRGRPEGRRVRRRRELLEAYLADEDSSFAVTFMSGDELSCRELRGDLMMERVRILRDRLDSPGIQSVCTLGDASRDQEMEQCFEDLHEAESMAGVTLWHPDQLIASAQEPIIPDELGLNIVVPDDACRSRLIDAWHARRWIVTMMASAGQSQDTAINLVDIAYRFAADGFAKSAVFYLIQNKYDDQDSNRPGERNYVEGEPGQREKLARLLQWAAPGCRAYSLTNWTPFPFKSGGMAAMDLVPEETMKLTNMMVLDRNVTVHDLDALMEDLTTALVDPGVVNVIPGRGTTNTLTPIGQASQAMEEGHRALMRGVMLMGGEAGESVGTGWGNIQAVYYGRTQQALFDPATPALPVTQRMSREAKGSARRDGLISFGPHAIGISEDIWAVTQAAQNAHALGLRPKFKRSKAMWHKMRETWSHADWFAAFPRWSGGYLQMMQDPLMQKINDQGTSSIFAKEHRANNGRFFMSAPFALLSILLMPLAIMTDASPFVQILVVLWNFGFVMNQVLTSLGLVATLEATGFSRRAAFLGWAAAGSLTLGSGLFSISGAALASFLGFLGGGFLTGLGRWLYYRGRDVILFGPQLVIFTLGQLVRQSLEFSLSGASASDAKGVDMAYRSWAGPQEAKPWVRYANLVNLRTVVWGVGGLSLTLSLIALASLDFLNVVLLLPSLLFSISCMIGPFLMRPKRGLSLGWSRCLPKLLGWVIGFASCLLVAGLVAGGGMGEKVALAAAIICLAWMAHRALRHALLPHRIRRARGKVVRSLRQQGGGHLTGNGVKELATQVLMNVMKPPAVSNLLRKAGYPSKSCAAVCGDILDHADSVSAAAPTEKTEREPTRRARFGCEFRRSLTLSFATIVWFLIVPVPGLLIFTAGPYRFAFDLGPFISTIAAAVGVVLLAAILGKLVGRFVHEGIGKRRLHARTRIAYRRFTALKLPAPISASVFALFTDLQLYIDQRAYAYAWRTLRQIDAALESNDWYPVSR